ncbi:MAG: bifunctional oligoribonuclease/PAP phosphatase NrnA [Lachnospiraceae bacterium]
MNLNEELSKVEKTVGISGHVLPDGDCVGSCLALANYIRDNFPHLKVDVYLEKFDKKLNTLPGADTVLYENQGKKQYDLYVALDCSVKRRLAVGGEYFDTAKKTICIDHHVSNEGYGDIFVLDGKASSAAEVLYQLFDPEMVSINTASCIYTGIVHDSGAFRFSNVSAKTMRIAADLLEKGVDASGIINSFLETSLQHQRLNGIAFQKVQLYNQGKFVYVYLTMEDYQTCGLETDEHVNVVGLLRDLEGVECSAFLLQVNEHKHKLSMRSRTYVDVNQVCALLGGGGHIHAAGATLFDVSEKLIRETIVRGVDEMIQAEIM